MKTRKGDREKGGKPLQTLVKAKPPIAWPQMSNAELWEAMARKALHVVDLLSARSSRGVNQRAETELHEARHELNRLKGLAEHMGVKL